MTKPGNQPQHISPEYENRRGDMFGTLDWHRFDRFLRDGAAQFEPGFVSRLVYHGQPDEHDVT